MYVGAALSKEDPTQIYFNNRLAKERRVFHELKPFWKSKQYNTKTKVILYNTNVKSVLIYGIVCWRVTKADMQSLSISTITAPDRFAN